MVGGHHQLDGHEFEQTPEDSKGQEGLVGEVGLRAGAAVTGQHLLLQCAS